MKRLLPLVTLTLGFSFVFGAKFWEKKPYTEWSERDAWSMLNSSPWTGRVSVWARVNSRSTRVDISGGSDRTDHKDLRAETNSDQAASRRPGAVGNKRLGHDYLSDPLPAVRSGSEGPGAIDPIGNGGEFGRLSPRSPNGGQIRPDQSPWRTRSSCRSVLKTAARRLPSRG